MILHIEWCYNSFWKLRYGRKDIYLVYMLHYKTSDENVLVNFASTYISIHGVWVCSANIKKLYVVLDKKCGKSPAFLSDIWNITMVIPVYKAGCSRTISVISDKGEYSPLP